MKRIVLATIVLLLPAAALASGIPAPQEAVDAMTWACEGPVHSAFQFLSTSPGYDVEAGATCLSLGRQVFVNWRRNAVSQQVIRFGIDDDWRDVPMLACETLIVSGVGVVRVCRVGQ